MASAVKKCTQLTGLAVVKNPHRVLISYYNKILRALENVPESSAYRQHTSRLVLEKLALVNSEPDIPKLEQKMNCGQVEEVIVQAEKELFLTRRMIAWKPWDPLQTEPSANQWKWPI